MEAISVPLNVVYTLESAGGLLNQIAGIHPQSFWFSVSGGAWNLRFWQTCRWCCCWWSGDHTLRTTAITYPSSVYDQHKTNLVSFISLTHIPLLFNHILSSRSSCECVCKTEFDKTHAVAVFVKNIGPAIYYVLFCWLLSGRNDRVEELQQTKRLSGPLLERLLT